MKVDIAPMKPIIKNILPPNKSFLRNILTNPKKINTPLSTYLIVTHFINFFIMIENI
jgi:hypothetical protein